MTRQTSRKKPRGMTHEEISEIVLGLMYRRAVAYRAVQPKMLMFPYDHAALMLQKGVTDQERIRAECGNAAVDAQMAAMEHLRDGGTNRLAILEKKFNATQLVKALREEADKVEQGREADAERIHTVLMRMDGDHQRPVPLSEIPDDQIPFTPTGYSPIDIHVGGFPPQGLIIVTAPPGAGKTSFGIQFCQEFARTRKVKAGRAYHTISGRASVFYTLEMQSRELARRAREICPLPAREKALIAVKEDLYAPEDIAYNIAREQWVRANNGEPPIELVVIDFADLMIEDEVSESQTALIYKDLSKTAKRENLPIILLSQPNRQYVNGGIVRPNHIRYSGLAEAMGWIIMSLYNPMTDFTGQMNNQELPAFAGRGYICVWKVRGGFREHLGESPGAIQVEWDGETAWGRKELGWTKLSTVAMPERPLRK